MATTLPNTGAVIPAMTEPADQAVNNAAFTAIDTAIGGLRSKTSTSLNLQNGWTGTIQYTKDSFGIVDIVFTVTAGNVAPVTLIATLPAGNRPKNTLAFTLRNSDYGSVHPVSLFIHNDGRIMTAQDNTLFTGDPYTAVVMFKV